MVKLWSSMLVLVVASMVAVGSANADDAAKKPRGERGKRPAPEQIFKKLDADGNGKVTAEEMVKSPRIADQAAAEARIKRMDTNQDGSVCVVEFKAALEKMHARRQGERKGGEAKRGERKKGEHKASDAKPECPSKGCPKKGAQNKEA